MADNQLKPYSPSALQLARNFRITGWISLGLQVTFGVISGVTILFTVSGGRAAEEVAAPGTGIGIFLAVCGVLVTFISSFLAFRYTRIAKRLEEPNPKFRPSRTNTIKVLKIGLVVSLVGMTLTLLGAEITGGQLLLKALTQPTALAVYDPGKIIRPLDVFVVQANINVIAAHFVGIVTSLWLLYRINPPKQTK